MLYQLRPTLVAYQKYRLVKERSIKIDESETGQTQIRDTLAIYDQKIYFLKQTIGHYESILDSWVKSKKFSDFDNMGSFLSGVFPIALGCLLMLWTY
jgi:hypothetical protein